MYIYIYILPFESTSSRWIHWFPGWIPPGWMDRRLSNGGTKIGGGRLGRWGGCGELMNPVFFKKKSGRYPVTLLEKGFFGFGNPFALHSVLVKNPKKNIKTAARDSFFAWAVSSGNAIVMDSRMQTTARGFVQIRLVQEDHLDGQKIFYRMKAWKNCSKSCHLSSWVRQIYCPTAYEHNIHRRKSWRQRHPKEATHPWNSVDSTEAAQRENVESSRCDRLLWSGRLGGLVWCMVDSWRIRSCVSYDVWMQLRRSLFLLSSGEGYLLWNHTISKNKMCHAQVPSQHFWPFVSWDWKGPRRKREWWHRQPTKFQRNGSCHQYEWKSSITILYPIWENVSVPQKDVYHHGTWYFTPNKFWSIRSWTWTEVFPMTHSQSVFRF